MNGEIPLNNYHTSAQGWILVGGEEQMEVRRRLNMVGVLLLFTLV
jgi:hypothetical protein